MSNTNDYGMQRKHKLWIAMALVLLSLSGLIAFGAKVLFAPVRGAGEAKIQKESANNRIAAQERFEALYAEVMAADQRLSPLARSAALDPTDKTASQTYTGAVTYCIGVRNEYNANARKYTQEAFKAADLPSVLTTTDTSTDCMETK